jgi:hypothetical protein
MTYLGLLGTDYHSDILVPSRALDIEHWEKSWVDIQSPAYLVSYSKG